MKTTVTYLAATLCSFALVACACSGSQETTSPRVNAANATAEVLTGQGCMRTGCSGHLCTEEGEQAVSTCQWKDEYACYKTARCEKQPDGNCGWTQSETLTTCLKSAAEKATGELKFAPQ